MNEPIGRSWGEGGAEGRWEAAGAGGAPGSPSSSSSSSSSSQAPARTTLGLPRRPLVRSRARRAWSATRGPCSRRRSSEEGGSPPPEGQSARGAGRRSARPPAASPPPRRSLSRLLGLLAAPPTRARLLARSLARSSRFPSPAVRRSECGEGPRGQRGAGGGGPGREQPAEEGSCPARAPRGPSAVSDRAAWTAACPPTPPGAARAPAPGARSPGRA